MRPSFYTRSADLQKIKNGRGLRWRIDCKAGQYVALTVKVVSVKAVTQVRANIGKIVDCQNVNVADKSGSVRVTFWNEDVDKVS